MSLLSKLFGGGGQKAPEPEIYNDFRIFPEPVKENGSYRIAARVEKDFDGEVKSHLMIRADTYSAPDTAVQASLDKAKQVIDQMGDALFR
ncbi:HlyU family transcriptional regulator [Aliiroseovarius subalbicans]|uniref:HlyU family transcriptional regulator n=1 Tax=Aliiroseovarius subalbicans TaxID=2925840 RepID=UPI001F58173D|nr:HlyU family transcriptional regulator [Aliiroseovarius subalbicans]MCI2398582.1 HlyU family transcriptional regulator [Aliiroseovarius subalbicans]